MLPLLSLGHWERKFTSAHDPHPQWATPQASCSARETLKNQRRKGSWFFKEQTLELCRNLEPCLRPALLDKETPQHRLDQESHGKLDSSGRSWEIWIFLLLYLTSMTTRISICALLNPHHLGQSTAGTHEYLLTGQGTKWMNCAPTPSSGGICVHRSCSIW